MSHVFWESGDTCRAKVYDSLKRASSYLFLNQQKNISSHLFVVQDIFYCFIVNTNCQLTFQKLNPRYIMISYAMVLKIQLESSMLKSSAGNTDT